MWMKLSIKVSTAFVFQHTHQTNFTWIKTYGHYLDDISDWIIGEVFTVLLILSGTIIMSSFFVFLQNLKTKMRAFQNIFTHFRIIKLFLKSFIIIDQTQKQANAVILGDSITFKFFLKLFLQFFNTAIDALAHEHMGFFDSYQSCIVIC